MGNAHGSACCCLFHPPRFVRRQAADRKMSLADPKNAMVALDAVARTLPDKDRYLSHVAKYAHGKARSKVGNAVRRGAAAHDYDDDVDGDK